MNELDRVWSTMLSRAIENAKNGERGDVADYLSLRAANDLRREAGIKWLFDSLIELATDRRAAARGVTVERLDPHSFQHGRSNLKGSRISLYKGVRCLSVEAGWTRTPADGFMRGGALAAARVSHFGMPKLTEHLHLVPHNEAPEWFRVKDDERRGAFHCHDIAEHFRIFAEL